MKIDASYVLREPEQGSAALPDSLDLMLNIGGSRVLGEIYLPSGVYEAPHPAVVLCHGIPGTNCNDDLAQSLRRMGCVVLRLYHRGAWGSDGLYSFSHCLEDALYTANWAREEAPKEYGIDPDNIFLAGHSNGGNTVLNAARQLPWIKGIMAFCPFDHAALRDLLQEEEIKALFTEISAVLHIESPEVLWQDSFSHYKEWGFAQLAPEFQHRNLLLIGGKRDTVAPPDKMVLPLWNALEQRPTQANHKLVLLDSNHSLDTARLALAETLGTWLEQVVKG